MPYLLIAGAFLAAVAALYVAAGIAAGRVRKWCPRCRGKGLKCINWLRCNPPPNYSFFACDRCGGQFVQVDRYDGVENPMVVRAGSSWEHDSGWGGPDEAGASPVG
jgi:hypothetical protein